MTAQRFDADACVVGGGPAGAALAWRLARLGHRVVVVERERFPRPHVGESLGPGIWPLLELLGARSACAAGGFAPASAARVRWGGPERWQAAARAGIVVDRGAFDELLLERARAAGATVLQPAVVGRAVAIAGGCELPVATGAGTRVLRARFVADASGRRRVLGGRRRRTSPRTVALHATWRGGALDTAQTHVEARPQHWLWGAQLAGDRFSAIAFVDPPLLRRLLSGGGIRAAYLALLADSSLFRHLPAGAGELAGAVGVCDATCYAADDPVRERSMAVGEAAFAIDPLSSAGVQTAIQTGLATGAALATLLAPDGDAGAARAYVREQQRHAVARHARLSAEIYRDCTAYAHEPFWRARALREPQDLSVEAHTALDVAEAERSASVSLAQLLDARVQLAREASLRVAPCVVGERVELRRALCHPALERPIAYLGGVELAPLLDDLDGERPLRAVLQRWAAMLQPGFADAIAAWLSERDLLEPCPASQ